MRTLPTGQPGRAESLLHALREVAAGFVADLRDIWSLVFPSREPAVSPPPEPPAIEEPSAPATPEERARNLWALVRNPSAAAASSMAPPTREARAVIKPPAPTTRPATASPASPPSRLPSASSLPSALARGDQRDALGVHVSAERGDDVATVLGRIEAADQPEVVLVVPRSVASLRTAPAWARLAGHARRRGLTLRVVAARAEVRGYARQTGLDAARTWQGLPGARPPLVVGGLRMPRALPQLLDSVGANLLALLAIILAATIAFAYFGPLARIEVSPPSAAVEERLQVRIDPIATRIDVGTLTLPATTVQRPVRVIVSAPATGSVPVGDRPAGVRLEFRNDGAAAIEVPAGTVARADLYPGFATTERVTVPAGQRATVDALAVQPGTPGNLGPGAVRLLDGWPATLTVVNPAAARGGADRLVPGVAQADVDRVRALADGVLTQAAVRDARAAYEGGLVLPNSVSIAILGQTPFQRLEEASDVFVAEYVAQAAVLVVLPETATRFAEAYLRSKLPETQDLVPGVSRVAFEGAPTLEAGQTRARVTLSGRASDRLEASALAEAVAGATPRDAKDRLRERLGLDLDPRVSVTPGWLPWPWLPRRADRIEVTLGAPDIASPRPAE